MFITIFSAFIIKLSCICHRPIPNLHGARGGGGAPQQHPPPPQQYHARGPAPQPGRRNPRLLVELAPSLEATGNDSARQTPLAHFYAAELGPAPDQGLATFPPSPQSDASAHVGNENLPRFENYPGGGHPGPAAQRGVDLVSWMGPPSPGRTIDPRTASAAASPGPHTFNFARGAARLESGQSPRQPDLPSFHHMKSSIPFGHDPPAPAAPRPPQFMSALAQLHGGVAPAEARRREDQRLQYQRDLEQQIREKKERDARAKAMRNDDDLRLERQFREQAAAAPGPSGRNARAGGPAAYPPPPQHPQQEMTPPRGNRMQMPPPHPYPPAQQQHSRGPPSYDGGPEYYPPGQGQGQGSPSHAHPPPAEGLVGSPRRKPGQPPPDTLNFHNSFDNQHHPKPPPHMHMQMHAQQPDSPGAQPQQRTFMAGLSELKPGLSNEQRRHAEDQRRQLVRDLEDQIREKKERAEAEKRKEREAEAREEANLRAYHERIRLEQEAAASRAQGPPRPSGLKPGGEGSAPSGPAPVAPGQGRKGGARREVPDVPPAPAVLPSRRSAAEKASVNFSVSPAAPPNIDAWLDEGAQPSTSRSALSHAAEMVPVGGGMPSGRPPRGAEVSRRSLAASEVSEPGNSGRRGDKSTSGRSTVHPEVTNLLRELRQEQEILREQLESHAAAMERVQAEAEAARRERDRAREELIRVQQDYGMADGPAAHPHGRDSLEEFMVESRLMRKSLDFIPDYIDERVVFRTSKSDSTVQMRTAAPPYPPPPARRGWAKGGIAELPAFAEDEGDDSMEGDILDDPQSLARVGYGHNGHAMHVQAQGGRKRPAVQGRRGAGREPKAPGPSPLAGARVRGVKAVAMGVGGGDAPAARPWRR